MVIFYKPINILISCVCACVLKTVNMFSSDKTKILWFVDKFLKCGGGFKTFRRIAEIKLHEKWFRSFPVKCVNKEAPIRAWKRILDSPLLLCNGNHMDLSPQYVKDFLLVVHSALTLYSLPRRVSLGTILYRKQVYSDRIQDKCIEERKVFTLEKGTQNTPCIDVHLKKSTFDTCYR